MGTRSSIKFYSNDTDHPLVNIFQMFDGYIDGVGYDLAQWLCSKIMINGIGERTSQEYCNGAGCLVAQFIKDKKVGVGGLYIDTMNRTCDYNYKVIINDCIPFDVDEVPVNNLTKIIVTNFNETEPIFKGTPEELLKFDEHGEEHIL